MESNLNLELIEKVRKGKACIEHTQFKEDNDKLKLVLLNAFPTSELAHYPFEEKYYGKSYIGSKADDWDIYVMGEEQTLEIIPLSAFFTNELPKEDKQLIAKIDEMLTQLNGFGKSLWELREHASLVLPDVAPIDTKKEVRYVRCVQSIFGFQDRQIYKLNPVLPNDTESGVIYDGKQWCSYAQYRMFFSPATEAEYLYQQEQPKWKEGEWAYCFATVYGSNYSFKKGEWYSLEEIKKSGLYFDNYFNNISTKKPDTIVKEEVKERWKPSYGCKYWYIGSNDGQFFVSDFHWGNDDVDFINHDNSNCFQTEKAAQLAADKIKALLATI